VTLKAKRSEKALLSVKAHRNSSFVGGYTSTQR